MFLEIIFNENYDPDYLRKAIDKINRYSIEYRTIYTDCYNFLKKIKVSSIGSKLGGIAGSAVEVTPMISKSNLDENLKGVSERIERLKDLNTEYFMKEFTMLKDDYSKPISDSIREIAKLFNGDIKLLLDDTTLYFGIE